MQKRGGGRSTCIFSSTTCLKTRHKLCSHTQINLFCKSRTERQKATHHHQRKLLPGACVPVLLDSFLLALAALLPSNTLSLREQGVGCIWVLGQGEPQERRRGKRSSTRRDRSRSRGEESGSCLCERRDRAAVRAYELSVPPTGEPTRPSPGFKPCHLKTKTPTHSISALP